MNAHSLDETGILSATFVILVTSNTNCDMLRNFIADGCSRTI
ncbi:MAG: hypothetical protein RR673_09530 [Erysipelotrichaceae bacterium]